MRVAPQGAGNGVSLVLDGSGFGGWRLIARLASIALLYLSVALGMPTGAVARVGPPQRVLMIHSYGKNFLPWNEYATGIRAELVRQATSPVSIEDYSLSTAASQGRNPEGPFADYLRSLYSRQQPDLIVTIGSPAANFAQRYRSTLFASTPTLFAAIDQRFIQQATLTENDAAVAFAVDFRPLVDNILQLLPETKQIAVMLGNSVRERVILDAMKRDLAPFEGRITISYHNEQSFPDMLKAVSMLPPNSAIFWNQLRVDGAGTVHEGEEALRQVYAAAKVPIFSHDDTFFKGEIVGGPMLSRADIIRETAAVAVRLLSGERPQTIKVSSIGFAQPRYDWRELRRWGISEWRLPQGSEILFRELNVWQKYRWQLLLLGGAFLLQGWLIAALLYERQARRQADGELRQRMSELARINRHSIASELSSSIAHEINQPLATILANAETGALMLNQQMPNLDEIRHILLDIQRDDHRASEIIRRLRSLVKNEPFESKVIDLNEVVREVLEMVRSTAERNDVELLSSFDAPRIQIKGDAVQLQQVVMNVVVNAIDALTGRDGRRSVMVRTDLIDRNARLAVIDSGPGISSDLKEGIFDPFFTTKAGNMGMGLAIVRTIVRAHGGRIWVEDVVGGGAAFQVTLPLARAGEA